MFQFEIGCSDISRDIGILNNLCNLGFTEEDFGWTNYSFFVNVREDLGLCMLKGFFWCKEIRTSSDTY